MGCCRWSIRGITSLVIILAIAMLGSVHSAQASPGPTPRGPAISLADADGDGIANELDPDDDNDGVPDDQEGGGTGGSPDILSPETDSDGDGIANSHDPDDNNNGVADEADPSTSPSSGGGTGTGDGDDSSGLESDQGNTTPLIRSLPVTGAGSNGLVGDTVRAEIWIYSLTSLLALAGLMMRNRYRTLACHTPSE